MIELINISKIYQQSDLAQVALQEINLTLAADQLVAIVGTSGSGKSTLMNILGLLDNPTGGDYLFEGRKVLNFSEQERAHFRNQTIGFVFQQFNLLAELTVIENILLPLSYSKNTLADKNARAMELLAKVGLTDKAKAYPKQLSGGQQQRVAIARALINQPRVILADEPTGALDKNTSSSIMSLLRYLQQTEQTSVIIVTHDPELAKQCDRQIRLEDGKNVD